MKISVNGKMVRRISLRGTEPEFHYGYGVFETMRTYGGQIFELSEHFRRLRRSAKAIKLTIKPTNVQLSRWLRQHYPHSGERRIKLIAAKDNIYILSTTVTTNFNSPIYRLGVKVTTYPGQRMTPQVKGNAWVLEYLANQFAQRHGYFDAFLVGPDKTVGESACGNIFIIRDNIISTANEQILPGVTRKTVLHLLPKAQLSIRFHTHTLNEILRADECFLTSTMPGIVPVVNISGKRIGNGKPGPMTQQLIRAFNTYVTKTSTRH